MASFAGFPSKMKLSLLPSSFFSLLLPEINDFQELKVTLALLYLMSEKRGYLHFISEDEIMGSRLLKDTDQSHLDKGLSRAIERGTFIELIVKRDEKSNKFYFLNAEPERKALEKIKGGELKPGSLKEKFIIEEEKNIFTLYEQNMGQITPLLAEELKEAEESFPFEWIEDAIKEAVALNKRSWRYVASIMERWAREGKTNGKTGRYTGKKFDPEDYFKKRYRPIVRGQRQ